MHTSRSRPSIPTTIPVAAILILLVIVLPPSPSSAQSASGSAQTTNAVLVLEAAGETVSVGTDTAQALRGDSRYASAGFKAGRATALEVGALGREGTVDSDSGTEEASEGDLSIDGLLSLTLVEASAGIDLSTERVASFASAELAGVDVMDGLVALEGIASATATEATDSGTEASRIISLDGVTLFDVGGLVDTLGVDRQGLTCAAIQDIGATLGVDSSGACAQLAAAEAAIAGANDALDQASTDLALQIDGRDEATVAGDRDTAEALGLDCDPLALTYLACVTQALTDLLSLAAEYGVDPADPTDLAGTRSEVLAAIDGVLAALEDLQMVQDATFAAADGTCDAVVSALEGAVGSLSALDPAGASAPLQAASDTIDAACDELRATLDLVFGTPVLTLDDVVFSLAVRAAEGDTDAIVVASIGSIAVGVNDPQQAQDLVAGQDLDEPISATIAQLMEDLAVDAPAPAVDLFVVETDDGQRDDGTWFATASITLLQLTLPAGPITVPDDAPFAVLGDADGNGFGAIRVGAFGAPYGAVLAAGLDAPQVLAQVGVFDAQADHAPAGEGGGDDDDTGTDDDAADDVDDSGTDAAAAADAAAGTFSGALPKTGAQTGMLVDVGIGLVMAALALRRSLFTR